MAQAEASEAALKLARKRGGPDRTEVVALLDGFHGRTYGSLSLTGQPGKQEDFRPLVPDVRHVEPGDLPGLDAAVSERTAAIFLEIVQGEIGVHPVPVEMIRRAREGGGERVFRRLQNGHQRHVPAIGPTMNRNAVRIDIG